MSKLLLVDGMNLLFQMYYGMPSRITNKDGRAIQGTLGFTGALLKIIRMTQPTALAVLFDGEHENARAELDPLYKANRAEDSRMLSGDTPFSQLDDVYSVLDRMGVKHTELAEYESDDVIASYALRRSDDTEVMIVSHDSDFFQLINDKVRVLRYRGEKSVICDSDYIKKKLGISPDKYAAYKSLTGDTADNIRGVAGVGPKTAATLINEFGTLDGLLARAGEIRKRSVREAVMSSRERLKLNERLITLDGSAELPFEPDELVYGYDGITTGELLAAVGLK